MFDVRTHPLRLRPALRDFRRLFESLPNAIIALRADAPRYTIVAASDAYLASTFTRRDGPTGIVGRSLFEVFPTMPYAADVDGSDKLRASLDRVVASASTDTLPSHRYDIRRPDGSWEERHWRHVNTPVRGADGRAKLIVHEVMDVTDLARAQEENAVKVRFLATMSHELRTPLNAIGGYVELIAMGIHGTVTAQQMNALDRIRHSEQHLLGLINEVLDYAKLESGHVELEHRTVSLAKTLDEVLSLVMPQAAAKHVDLSIGPTTIDGYEVAVIGDGEKVRQVLLNLLSNAVKFTPAGGRVRVECTATKACVWIVVSDTGVGLDTEELGRIFEPFVQVGGREASKQGTGLGLSISRELARAMGGDVTVKSRKGEGSSFIVRLTRAAAHDERRSA